MKTPDGIGIISGSRLIPKSIVFQSSIYLPSLTQITGLVFDSSCKQANERSWKPVISLPHCSIWPDVTYDHRLKLCLIAKKNLLGSSSASFVPNLRKMPKSVRGEPRRERDPLTSIPDVEPQKQEMIDSIHYQIPFKRTCVPSQTLALEAWVSCRLETRQLKSTKHSTSHLSHNIRPLHVAMTSAEAFNPLWLEVIKLNLRRHFKVT